MDWFEKARGRPATANNAVNALIDCILSVEDESYPGCSVREDIEKMVRSAFDLVGSDFDNPTKRDLLVVCREIREAAQKRYPQAVIEKHYKKMKAIVDRISD
ncbi:MAG: hypothetical protein JW834_03585 [Candidatus Diapherotrites archaeon]|nr:hypothetical protein [Candidatus Diapherotrites archaeon]